MRIETDVKLDFKDVLIRPKRSTLIFSEPKACRQLSTCAAKASLSSTAA